MIHLKKQKGFTLIEILVVIAIIAVLTAVIIVAANSARQKARISEALNDLGRIQLALASYQADHHGTFPVSPSGWSGLYSNYGASTPDWIPGLVPKYIPALPRSPNNSTDGSNNYIYLSDGMNYKVIWHNPEECLEVKKSHPEVIDPIRDCWAYGYWSPGAATTF